MPGNPHTGKDSCYWKPINGMNILAVKSTRVEAGRTYSLVFSMERGDGFLYIEVLRCRSPGCRVVRYPPDWSFCNPLPYSDSALGSRGLSWAPSDHSWTQLCMALYTYSKPLTLNSTPYKPLNPNPYKP